MNHAERLLAYKNPNLRSQAKRMVVVKLQKGDTVTSGYQSVMLHENWAHIFIDAYWMNCRAFDVWPADVQTLNIRRIAGSDNWSLHSWALAADVFAPPSKHGPRDPKTNRPLMPEEWYLGMASYGIEWGGKWRKRDPHHLQWSN